MQSSVNNSKSRAYQRALAKNLESQRRLDTEYMCIDYIKHKARCDVNSQIYQLKAELYKIRAKTPSLDDFRRGKRIVGIENFNQDIAAFNNDLYEVVNGKLTKTKKKNPNVKQPPSTLIELYPIGGRQTSHSSRPSTGKGSSQSGMKDRRGISSLEDKKKTELDARKQAVADQTPSSADIGDKMNEILGLSKDQENRKRDEQKKGLFKKRTESGTSDEQRDEQMERILGLATKEDLRSQKRSIYGIGLHADIDVDSDSDDSDNGERRRRTNKTMRDAASAPPHRQGVHSRNRWEEDTRRPRQPKSASLESRSRRVRSRRILVDTPRSPSPEQLREATQESIVNIESILNPINTLTSANPYQSMFRPELVTVRRVARMSAISRKLRLVEYNQEEYDYGKPDFLLEKVEPTQIKEKRKVTYKDN